MAPTYYIDPHAKRDQWQDLASEALKTVESAGINSPNVSRMRYELTQARCNFYGSDRTTVTVLKRIVDISVNELDQSASETLEFKRQALA